MKFNFIDIGSRGDIGKYWDEKFIKNIITFDPIDSDGSESITKFLETRFHYPYAVYDIEGLFDFNICKKYRVSSLYELDLDVIKTTCYSKNLELFEVIDKVKVKCVRLDSILEKHRDKFDFLKVDAQGADLDVLKSCGKFLYDFKGIQIECNHIPIYKNSPLTKDIHKYLTNMKFSLLKVISPAKGKRKVWCDRVYVNSDNSAVINNFLEGIYKKRK